MEEIWKDIKGYEGLYRVSNKGRVYSIKYGIIRKPMERSTYLLVNLTKDGKPKFYAIHRLVAQAFIPNPDNKPEVNHINENKQDNRVENLEWCTRLENIHHGTGIARQAETKRHSAKAEAWRRPVAQYTLHGEYIATYRGIKEASKALGLGRQNIGKCAAGKAHTAYGYKWKFVEKEGVINGEINSCGHSLSGKY